MRLSIVTPSLNQLDWLELCIASVADQFVAHQRAECQSVCIEHIVCDAGSSGIVEFQQRMLARFPQKTDYRLDFLVAPDGGMYDAINKGLARSSGEVCAYLNCDEQYLVGALPFVAEWLSARPWVDIGFGDIVVTSECGDYICDRTAVLPEKWHTMTSGNLSVFSAGTFFRRSSVVERKILFDPQWKMVGDAAWILKLLDARVRMGCMKRILASFTYSKENLSQQKRAREERLRLRSAAPLLPRILSPLTVALSRFRRMFAGGYSLAPHAYEIYTRKNALARTRFNVPRPSHRWPTPV
jgi:glycosyltransferase involved in cell wall biosynthesis